MDIIHGYYPWISSMDNIHGYHSWILSIDIIHGYLDPLDPYEPPSCSGNKQKNYNNNNMGRFPGGGLENKNPARTIAHSPPGVKETLNYMLRERSAHVHLSRELEAWPWG